VSVLVAARGAQVAGQAVQAGKQISTELLGYDFVGLLVKIVFFQLAALAIAKYIEAVIGTSNFIVNFAKLLGFQIPSFLPQSVVDFYTSGWNGIKYWDVVKLATVAIIAFEMHQYAQTQKRLGAEPSTATLATFPLIIGFFLIITLPELIQRIKDANAIVQPPPGEVEL
jgi:hypothetical protein